LRGWSIGNLSSASLAQTIRGLILMERGDPAEGLPALRDAVECGEQANNAYAMTGIRAELAWAIAWAGGIAEAADLARQALAEAETHFPSGRDWVAAIQVRIFLLAGDLPSAMSALPPGGLVLTDQHLQEAAMFGGVAIGLAAAEWRWPRVIRSSGDTRWRN
jgi:hypothetical protein